MSRALNQEGKLPKEIIDQWPEIFKDIEIRAIPIKYVDVLHVSFENGEQWTIDLTKPENFDEDETVEDAIEEFFYNYSDYITNVEFDINTTKVIKDVKVRTHKFFKKRK